MHQHRVSTNNLNRTAAHKNSLMRNMSGELVRHGAIETTLVNARALRPIFEKLITSSRKGDLAARRRAHSFLFESSLVNKLMDEVAPLFKSRNGGYTRIIKLGPRIHDGAEMARIELVEKVVIAVKQEGVRSKVKSLKTKMTKVKEDSAEQSDAK